MVYGLWFLVFGLWLGVSVFQDCEGILIFMHS